MDGYGYLCMYSAYTKFRLAAPEHVLSTPPPGNRQIPIYLQLTSVPPDGIWYDIDIGCTFEIMARDCRESWKSWKLTLQASVHQYCIDDDTNIWITRRDYISQLDDGAASISAITSNSRIV